MARKLLSSHSYVFACRILFCENPLVGYSGGEKIAAILSLDQSLVSTTLSVFQ